MDVFQFRKFEEPGPHHSILTVGNFDGVHLGHQQLIHQVVREAGQMGLKSALLTFQPHPQEVIQGTPPGVLTTMPMRLRLFEQLGLDAAYFIPFTLEFSRKTPEEFINEYLLAYFQVKKLVIGFDFHFGRNRSGSAQVLSRLSSEIGFEFEEFPEFSLDGEKVSSSKIRAALARVDFASAERSLGRPYSILEKVIPGEKRGREIGFPTVNLIPDGPLPLPFGVYASRIVAGENTWLGVSNYGTRPTVGSERPQLETHILDFDGDLYGEMVEVIPVQHLREERRFSSLDALKEQIGMDRDQARKILAAR